MKGSSIYCTLDVGGCWRETLDVIFIKKMCLSPWTTSPSAIATTPIMQMVFLHDDDDDHVDDDDDNDDDDDDSHNDGNDADDDDQIRRREMCLVTKVATSQRRAIFMAGI